MCSWNLLVGLIPFLLDFLFLIYFSNINPSKNHKIENTGKSWKEISFYDWTNQNKHHIQYQNKTNLKQNKTTQLKRALFIRYNKNTKTHLMRIQIQTTPLACFGFRVEMEHNMTRETQMENRPPHHPILPKSNPTSPKSCINHV